MRHCVVSPSLRISFRRRRTALRGVSQGKFILVATQVGIMMGNLSIWFIEPNANVIGCSMNFCQILSSSPADIFIEKITLIVLTAFLCIFLRAPRYRWLCAASPSSQYDLETLHIWRHPTNKCFGFSVLCRIRLIHICMVPIEEIRSERNTRLVFTTLGIYVSVTHAKGYWPWGEYPTSRLNNLTFMNTDSSWSDSSFHLKMGDIRRVLNPRSVAVSRSHNTTTSIAPSFANPTCWLYWSYSSHMPSY